MFYLLAWFLMKNVNVVEVFFCWRVATAAFETDDFDEYRLRPIVDTQTRIKSKPVREPFIVSRGSSTKRSNNSNNSQSHLIHFLFFS